MKEEYFLVREIGRVNRVAVLSRDKTDVSRGVVLNAPVIHKQANRCKCSNFLPAVVSSTLGHHTIAAYVSEGLIIAVYMVGRLVGWGLTHLNLRSRCGHYIFAVVSIIFSSPNLSR